MREGVLSSCREAEVRLSIPPLARPRWPHSQKFVLRFPANLSTDIFTTTPRNSGKLDAMLFFR